MKQVFGIRHHGPGSARSLVRALEAMRPDAVLIEGPADADEVLPLAAHARMDPPVALLVYRPDRPQRAVYYPFAVFSPEWQAMRWALARGVEVRFMDLPQALQLVDPEPSEEDDADDEGEDDEDLEIDEAEERRHAIRLDPLRHLAEAAGYNDGERWWEHMVEQRRGDERDLFAAILEAMTALRAAAGDTPSDAHGLREQRREAFMRRTIRDAEKAGRERIAVVCGAWHGPALAADVPPRADEALLRNLPRAKVLSTWIPWTYGRLTLKSGYGAGIASPGWYHHLYTTPDHVATRWLAGVARLLRDEGIEASSAQVVDAVRLAETLAALRARPLPGLPELDEAAQAVLCAGRTEPMQLVAERLIVGDRIGLVPDEAPSVPLAQDLERERKRLRLKQESVESLLELDLRSERDRDKSRLLHRLQLLDVHWGEPRPVPQSALGTFKEIWRLRWAPELAIALIEASTWGNTIADASAARAADRAADAVDLPALTALLSDVLDADLPAAIAVLMRRIEAESALTGDVQHLLAALPSIAEVLRRGDVRKTDTTSLRHAVDGMVARICIGLPGACASLDDGAAQLMISRIGSVDGALHLINVPAHLQAWHEMLARLLDRRGLHGLVAGRIARLLLDAEELSPEEAERRAGLALSPGTPPAAAAAWVEGFLRGSALLILHDDRLWRVLDAWIASLSDEAFPHVLPLLRRTFATFSAPERRRIGERAKRREARPAPARPADFDVPRADAALPLLARLLGLDAPRAPQGT